MDNFLQTPPKKKSTADADSFDHSCVHLVDWNLGYESCQADAQQRVPPFKFGVMR